jgi:hypothetical protein
MKNLKAAIVLLSAITLPTVGCGDDGTGGSSDYTKCKVDDGTISNGVTVALSGEVGSITVPLTEPVPSQFREGESAYSELLDELGDGRVVLTVTSDETLTSANLMDGTAVEGDPSGPGEYTWEVAPDGEDVTLTFWNETSAGTTLKSDRTYTAELSIAFNAVCDGLSSVRIPVTVSGN